MQWTVVVIVGIINYSLVKITKEKRIIHRADGQGQFLKNRGGGIAQKGHNLKNQFWNNQQLIIQ